MQRQVITVVLAALAVVGCDADFESVSSLEDELVGPGAAGGTADPSQGYLSSTYNYKPGVAVCKYLGTGASTGHYGLLTAHHVLGDWAGTFGFVGGGSVSLVGNNGGDSQGCTDIGPFSFCRGTSASSYTVAPISNGQSLTSASLIDPFEYGTTAAVASEMINTGSSCGSSGGAWGYAAAGITVGANASTVCPGSGASVSSRKGTYSCFNGTWGAGGTAPTKQNCCALRLVTAGCQWIDDAGCLPYAPACQVPNSERGACAQPANSVSCTSGATQATFATTPGAGPKWLANSYYGTACTSMQVNGATYGDGSNGGMALFSGSTLVGMGDTLGNSDSLYYQQCLHRFSGTGRSTWGPGTSAGAWTGDLLSIRTQVNNWCLTAAPKTDIFMGISSDVTWPGQSNASGTTVESSACGGASGREVAYLITASNNINYVSAIATGFTPVVYVRRMSDGADMGCAVNPSAYGFFVNFQPGVDYVIFVDSTTTATGSFTLHVNAT